MSVRLGRAFLVVAATVGAIGVADAQIIPIAQQRAAPTDELAELSRRADDPFADLEAQSEREPVSVTLRALDKTTARYVDIEASIDEVATFGRLEIVPRFCDKRPPEEFPETTAFLQIYDLGLGGPSDDEAGQPAQEDVSANESPNERGALASEDTVLEDVQDAASASPLEDDLAVVGEAAPVLSEGKVVFSGWMFASSPALNALEHPVYDVWVIDCKTVVASN